MEKSENKRKDRFLTVEIENLVVTLKDKGLINRTNFENKCYNYLKKVNNLNVINLKSMLWVTLTPRAIVTWEDVKKSVILINNIVSNNITFDEKMFNEPFKMFEKNFYQQNGIVKI